VEETQFLDLVLRVPFTDEEFKSFRDAILSYLSLCQANLEAEKNLDDLIAVIKAITEKNSDVKKLQDARAFWRRLQIHLAPFIDLDKEALVEMRRQFWTTFSNLSQWYDGWENFLVSKDFATKEADGSVVFTEKQKQHIINIDETKLSEDGSDGGLVAVLPARFMSTDNSVQEQQLTSQAYRVRLFVDQMRREKRCH